MGGQKRYLYLQMISESEVHSIKLHSLMSDMVACNHFISALVIVDPAVI